uniref:Protein-glucosylgalactosylhydroxylysine glucosidase n=1 Tax=Xiphophorus couchianus TaxID=32473 RepID=A0A3B5N0B3_9TELE
MHMGGVYNGAAGDCHRADVPCPLAVKIETEEPAQHNYTLDTHTIFSHTLSSASVTASQSLYCHRFYANILVMEVLLERRVTSEEPVVVNLVSSFAPQSKDIQFESSPDYKGGHIQGQTAKAEFPGESCPTVHLIWTPVPSTVSLPPEQTKARWGFILVVANSLEDAKSSYDEGLNLMATGNLRPSHEKAWKELWLQSKVEVMGSETLSKAVVGCMFYLLSAFPSIHDTSSYFGGLSPGGLSNGGDGQDYWGHVFWDQDIWMYPGIALFYPKLARSVLEYRVGTIDGAKDNAQKQGYKQGLKFPWESAVSGREVCPDDIYGQQEIHINGDVTLAFQHYLYLTEDLSMFTEGRGSEVIFGVADYWVSRVKWNPDDQKYHLLVMPPDEYYYNVNNSVYTNTVAKLLQFAVELADLVQHSAPKEWQEVAERIEIPFDQELQYHPEYDGYKQADTVMLGYPLGLPMPPEVRRTDLEAYEPVTDPNGPAMTWGMFAIGWLELGEAEKAQRLLEKCFKNIQGPFQVQKECLAFAPLLPDEICELCVRGINYLGNQMDWLLRKDDVCVILREQTGRVGNTNPQKLQIVLKASGAKIPLMPQPVTFPREAGCICKMDPPSFCWLL